VLCTFSAPGSFVDKHIPGRRIRENGMTVRVGKSVNENISPSAIVDTRYQANVQNKNEHTTGVKDLTVDPVSEQSQTLVEESEVEGATSEEIENTEQRIHDPR
jgi:hypothetical protein